MTSNTQYWRQSKLDHLEAATAAIDDKNALIDVIKQMTDVQIRAVYREFEDPYSDFNYGREYDSYHWESFKAAVQEVRSGLVL